MVTSLNKLRSFLPGMYVRLPLEIERSDSNFRNFGLGQICHVDHATNIALVKLYGLPKDAGEVECPLEFLDRCPILPYSEYVCAETGIQGRVLAQCQKEWLCGEYLEYYVQVKGESGISRISEENIQVFWNRQNYDPLLQLQRYEFQNPVWKFPRDHLIECYSDLHNATFGIEELVGTRLMLLAHQAEVVSRVLADTMCRYILADEVGLGKTIEACVILKGLRKRDPSLRTLIIVPATLAYQWQNELNSKFWLKLSLLHTAQQLLKPSQPGYILCAEDLAIDESLWLAISKEQWGLLILDEAHHLHKSPLLYSRIHQLSTITERVLVLSATPIQRYAREYLSLLSLMNPHRYDIQNVASFEALLQAQDKIRRRIAILARTLTKEDFDAEEFVDEMDHMWMGLKQDMYLMDLINHVDDQEMRHRDSLPAAKEALAYVSENYQIERRVIRNRRAHLSIPMAQRELDSSWSYDPDIIEAEVMEELYTYLETYTEAFADHPLTAEYCRIWMYASASSPHALLDILETRLSYLASSDDSGFPPSLERLLIPASPRLETRRIEHILRYAPFLPEEQIRFLDLLLMLIERWLKQTEEILSQTARRFADPVPSPHRLVNVLHALHTTMSTTSSAKVLVFSGWLQTLEALLPHIEQRYGRNVVAQFHCGLDDEYLQEQADYFQSVASCRILLCDELGGEGRNFQIAEQVIHIDLPWTPAQIEQRIGRVDRLGREGAVRLLVPFVKNWPEEELFHIWQDAFQLFTHSMSGMEIALEGIQEELLAAIKGNPRQGLASLVTNMVNRAAKIRDEVEEERYFEEIAVNTNLREEFEHISERFRDGKLLRRACLKWANIAGLRADDPRTDILTFRPKSFSIESMKSARFLSPPNMEEALHRSGRKNTLVIRGTFNRDIAVRHEELVFFAPGDDPWTDAIIRNAIEADRGRCTAVLRQAPAIQGIWRGFELLYSLTIDPRPLYQLGYDPTNLFRGAGFLRTSTYRLLLSEDGRREKKGSLVWDQIQQAYSKDRRGDIHLGKRDGKASQIQHFKKVYPIDEWHSIIHSISDQANRILSEELDEYMIEVAKEAQTLFERQIAGLKAAYHWREQYKTGQSTLRWKEVEDYERISQALVEGIQQPIRSLESVCYWVLQGSRI